MASMSLVAFSHLESTDWSALAAFDPGAVPCVYYVLASGVLTTPLLSSAPYVAWPSLDFATASCRIHEYLGDEDRDSVSIRSTEDPVSGTELFEIDMGPAIPTPALFFLGTSLQSSLV